MMSARRAYGDAVKWIKSARPRHFRRLAYAERAVGASIAGALPLLAVIGLVSPASFASPASNTLRSGWPLYVVLGLLAVSLLYLATRFRRIRWALTRLRAPFLGPPEGDPRYEGAADALAACPGPLRTRFALWWVWGPAGFAALGIICAVSATYFVIDAVLARFNVAWVNPVMAGANLALGYLFFALVAGRLATWRLALAVYRSVTVGY